ncbi:P-loop containing nucleoside triphosphate hydrolase protein [Xylaria intraflava]|nr:P-loop containing nucleoside triphosphate hydrolase protein [Xylaria intraflava]
MDEVVSPDTSEPAGQVAAVERLAYRKADTVLVAATGYGKSAVLYAFAAITGRITIQIVPLTQLGQAQLEDIARDVAGSSPVFVDADTYLKNKNIWEEIRAGKYSHVLLSPEQALNPQFKAILRSPGFHSRIGLFAIDELHVVQEWRDFRKDFTYLHTLRSLLPRRLPCADKERIYSEFSRVGSKSRVAIVTIAFGMGLHIPDVRTIVQYGLPIEPSISDLWQRLGRAMRKLEGQGTAYIFVPYWLFDHLARARRDPYRARIASRLQEVTLVEADDNNIDASAPSDHSEADSTATHDSLNFTLFGADKREGLNPNIKALFNSMCFRRQALYFLQESDDPNLEYKRPVPHGLCCNRCNSDLGPVPPLQPRSSLVEEKPQANSFAAVALGRISAYGRGPTMSFLDLEGLLRAVPALEQWRYLEAEGEGLAKMCFDVFPELTAEWDDLRQQRASKRAETRARTAARIGITQEERVRPAEEAQPPTQARRTGN